MDLGFARAAARPHRHQFARRTAAAAARLCRGASRPPGSSASAGTRSCGRTSASRPPPISMRSVGDRPVVLERVDGHAVVANSAAMSAAGVTRRNPGAGGRRDRRTALFVDNAAEPDRQGHPDADRRARSTRRWPRRRRSCSAMASPASADGHVRRPIGRRSAAPASAGRLNVRLMSYLLGTESMAAVPRPDRLAVRRPAARGRRQVLCRRRARLARRVAQAALCRQAGHARPSVPFRCGDADARRHGGGGRLPGRDPRDRRCRQCADHLGVYEQLSQQICRRPALADRACPDRRSGRHSAPRAGRDHRLDAADPPDQRPADGRGADGPDRLAGAYAWQTRAEDGARLAFGSDFPVGIPNPSPASPPRSAARTCNGQPPGGWIPRSG